MANKIIPYRRDLKKRAQEFRKNQTPAEQELWESIRKKYLGVEFHRQVPMLDYIIDFYCHEIGLAIEVDGSSHDNNFLEDAHRQGRIEEYGVHFLRYSNEEVLNNLPSVLKEIRAAVEESL